ncbi:dihydroorotate dehydrogenase [Levilactobacillus bambusae]|uniref:Dihydroorotate dehydrogenase n=1 Tax=Levilactobacillus bambusae TaxID=2024736 RepID=A0A2V1N018_9LACO|nr:dihydroorotate dehydrogenase [Levilactobacillus bambusae]PWF99689.1 dihydroorotate dehydrogenase [Levilactobacillus bambusae]
MSSIKTQIAGITLNNPIMPASGTAGFGEELSSVMDLSELGAFVTKSTTLEPWTGNAKPVVAETTGGWLNAVGLKNPGVQAVMNEKLPGLAEKGVPAVASVAGKTVEEYVAVAVQLSSAPNVAWLELNISCPNVKQGGLSFGTNPETVTHLTSAVVAAAHKPVFVKLTPNVTDITVIARAAERGGAAGFTLINTLTGLKFDLMTRRPVLSNGTGGLSGRAIHPLAIRMVRQVREISRLPIIGVGGVFTAEDVLEFIIAGANAVQVGAARYGNPQILSDLIQALPAVLERYHIDNLQDLIDQTLTEVAPHD